MTARNPKAFEEGQAVRAAVRAILVAHVERFPLARLPKSSAIRDLLPRPLRRSEGVICGHVREILKEAAAEAKNSRQQMRCIDESASRNIGANGASDFALDCERP